MPKSRKSLCGSQSRLRGRASAALPRFCEFIEQQHSTGHLRPGIPHANAGGDLGQVQSRDRQLYHRRFSSVSDPDPTTDEVPIPRQLDQELELPAPEITGDPEQLLAEASVYLRYGKRAQAVENLEAILAADPEHRGALAKRK